MVWRVDHVNGEGIRFHVNNEQYMYARRGSHTVFIVSPHEEHIITSMVNMVNTK